MYVTIEIHYKAGSHINQSNTFPVRGKRPEQVTLDWWKEIKKEMSYHATLEKVIANGDQDITQLVLDLEEDQLNRLLSDDLPF